MEEINYGYNYKNIIRKSKNSKAYFYIKNIYDIGIDINFIFNFKNYINISITGYIMDYNDYKYIPNYETLQKLLVYNNDDSIIKIKGEYDLFTRSGLLSFNNINSINESFKADKYYLIEDDLQPKSLDKIDSNPIIPQFFFSLDKVHCHIFLSAELDASLESYRIG